MPIGSLNVIEREPACFDIDQLLDRLHAGDPSS